MQILAIYEDVSHKLCISLFSYGYVLHRLYTFSLFMRLMCLTTMHTLTFYEDVPHKLCTSSLFMHIELELSTVSQGIDFVNSTAIWLGRIGLKTALLYFLKFCISGLYMSLFSRSIGKMKQRIQDSNKFRAHAIFCGNPTLALEDAMKKLANIVFFEGFFFFGLPWLNIGS